MEIRFDRDLRHNYMVLCGIGDTGDYRLRMLSENRPQGLLACSLRNFNGQGYLYYEINSRQTIGNRYAGGLLTASDLRRLLLSIRDLQAELENYLLDAEHVLFSADCVYTDVRTGDFYFVYCPFDAGADAGQDGCGDHRFSDFAEELLSLLAEGDDAAARMGYLLCELAGSGEMLLTDILREALKENVTAAEECGGGFSGEGADSLPEPAGMQADVSEYSPYSPPTAARESIFAEVPPEAEDLRERGSSLRKIGWLLLALLFAAVFAGNIWIRFHFWLDSRENILSLATAGVSLLMGILSVVLYLRGGRNAAGKAHTSAEEDDGEDGWIRPVLPEAAVDVPKTGIAQSGNGFGHAAGPSATRDRVGMSGTDPTQDEETTVLCEGDVLAGHKLYSRGGGKTINIALDHLPFTIGKLAGCADYCIPDPSVSRMHTRFFGDASGMVSRMQDLNSTNGTFLNGRRLKPNETVSIRPGDEIGIGHLEFEFL